MATDLKLGEHSNSRKSGFYIVRVLNVCVRTSACMCACVRACICVYIPLCVCVCSSACARAYVRACVSSSVYSRPNRPEEGNSVPMSHIPRQEATSHFVPFPCIGETARYPLHQGHKGPSLL